MKISSNIELAENNYPGFYHVVNSNEVHSFETFIKAHENYCDAIIYEERLKTNFKPEIVRISGIKIPTPPPVTYTYYDSEAGMQNEKFYMLNLIIEYIENFNAINDSTGTIYQNGKELLRYENINNNLIWKSIN
jgi:hypothetical protein